ncbi:putative secondary metabolism biosynthetic enzyme [Arachnomyces sp. PD_36]|nr:putative secondary metabolism biosynthetic enzyme [Arachnomyces sp. PD_36]
MPPAPAAETASNGVMKTEESTPVLNTMPGEDFSWQITLSGKVIAITGANRGIGIGIAEVCLANSAKAVYSMDLMEPGEDFFALQKRFPNFHYIQTDVTSEESIEKAVDHIVQETGRIDGMVANAGMTKHQPALKFDRSELDKLFQLNVYGAYFCAQIVARKFIALGIKGSIVFTSSMTSYRPNRAAPSAPYGGTKAATRNMAHTLAMEWAKHGIRVNSISPGFVRTAMTYYVEKSPDWDLKMQYYGGMPRLADPRELGGAYVYLLSDGASYTTGIDIPVAGIVGAW